jgi:hypothetical protein
VRTAYRDWLWNVEKKTLDDQRPSWDLVTVYFAVEGPGRIFGKCRQRLAGILILKKVADGIPEKVILSKHSFSKRKGQMNALQIT